MEEETQCLRVFVEESRCSANTGYGLRQLSSRKEVFSPEFLQEILQLCNKMSSAVCSACVLRVLQSYLLYYTSAWAKGNFILVNGVLDGRIPGR